MPYEAYIEKRFRRRSMELIGAANAIIAEYQNMGFSLTLRQLYYQFVSRDVLPNTQESYNNLGSLINDARLAGLVDWDAIEDRTRNVRGNAHWESLSQIVLSCEEQFAFDKWAEQEHAPEVWIEKDALIGVIEGVCKELDVPYFACRGYSSQSEQWRAGKRFAEAHAAGREPIVFHLGDHDPSGIDMTRDNRDRLSMFCGYEVRVERLALNWNQVERYRPPPNPAKNTDSRAHGYVSRYGNKSWELDALDPVTIAALVRRAVLSIRDEDLWASAVERENNAKARLALFRLELEDEDEPPQ